ncbi:MAG: hypothetical protein EXS31_11065 [Pedosphaera sp.]|nr:hypothetical protein [Pedosphaera sp.]
MVVLIIAWLWPNDERAIRKSLADLARAASIRSGESAIGKIANANKVIEFFTQDITMQIDGINLHVNDRSDLREKVLATRSQLQRMEVQFEEVHVTIDPATRQALVYTVALATIEGQTNTLVRELKVQLHKPERYWLISRIESVVLGQ